MSADIVLVLELEVIVDGVEEAVTGLADGVELESSNKDFQLFW